MSEVEHLKRNNTYSLRTNRVGVFATLTNSYALVAVGASENFYRYAWGFSMRIRTIALEHKI